jgi:hypothetical protein
MSEELMSMLRSFQTYEMRVLTQMTACRERLERHVRTRGEGETAGIDLDGVDREIAGLRKNLREARLALVRILCREVRVLLDRV